MYFIVTYNVIYKASRCNVERQANRGSKDFTCQSLYFSLALVTYSLKGKV